jgi:hypothetical protein
MIRRIAAVLAFGFIAIAGFGATALATGTTPTTICHKEEGQNPLTLVIDDDGALNGHLGHGDTLGACEGDETTTTTETTTTEPVDVCPNIEGVQESPPPGFGIVDGLCVFLDITPQCAPPQVLDPASGLCVTPGPAAERCPPGTGPYGGKDTDESDPYHNQECCPDLNNDQICDDQVAIWDSIHALVFKLRFLYHRLH